MKSVFKITSMVKFSEQTVTLLKGMFGDFLFVLLSCDVLKGRRARK